MTSPVFAPSDRSDLFSQLQAGAAAMIPTDTLPALVALPQHAGQIWQLKRRALSKPLILMAADPHELLLHAEAEVRGEAAALAATYWPGALTLVLPASGSIVRQLHPGAATLGMRIPDCAPTLDLLETSGPLATTSINRSGEPAAETAQEAHQCFPSLPLLGPVPWPHPSGRASTVLSWLAPGQWQLLREGAVIPRGLSVQPSCSG